MRAVGKCQQGFIRCKSRPADPIAFRARELAPWTGEEPCQLYNFPWARLLIVSHNILVVKLVE